MKKVALFAFGIVIMVTVIAVNVSFIKRNGFSSNAQISLIKTMPTAQAENGTGTDCWWEIRRGGSQEQVACQVWVGSTAYGCKTVMDLDWFDTLGTCL